MSKTIPFSLITPTAVIFEGEASLVITTGTEGEIGIMAGHSPFLTALKPGVLRAEVLEHGNERRLVLATSAGFMQALPGRIIIIVDAAVKPETVDVEETQAELEAALARLKTISTDQAAVAREQETIDFAGAKLATRN